jgi:hypothetical protein
MPSIKRLNSVCNSIAQHAVSFLSYLHPHLRLAIKQFGLKSITIDLLNIDPCPEQFRKIEPVHLSLISLRKRFEQILLSEGFTFEDIKEITLVFEIPKNDSDDWLDCTARLIAKTGKIYMHAVNYMGRPKSVESLQQ